MDGSPLVPRSESLWLLCGTVSGTDGVCETGVIYTSIPGTFFPDSMSLTEVLYFAEAHSGRVM